MSQILLPGHVQEYPQLKDSVASLSGITLNATGETCHMIGYVMLENPLGVSKTISSAGGGSIVWRASTVTFANGSSVFDVGLQDVSTAASPSQGDGTFDVKASFTGGGGGITTVATNTSVMTTGTKTVAHGDLISITFALTTAAGADSIIVNCNPASASTFSGPSPLIPTVISNTSGSYARTSSVLPNAYIVFDDGTIGWIFGTGFTTSSNNTQTYNSGTGTADEYGNLINSPVTFYAAGITMLSQFAGNSSDCELILYSTPLGTPVAERTITMDATQISVTATTTKLYALFPVPFLMKANTDYAIAVRPTTTNNVTIFYSDINSSVGGKTSYPNSNCYAVRRLNNTGEFSDYNGGTAKTRLMSVSALGSGMEQGVNSGNYRIGI